ncbi:MAG TPA: Ppx/GppA family phosphatase [Stellaceae bacterium]|nr:Ppx/GppA family phosphatase [Stellaceae bacterium]
MPDRNSAAVPLGRIAVVDLGSNSLRLVVFERLGATLLPLLNEKVMCALGRGIAASGRLNPDGVALALANLQRFVALARALEVDHLAIVATAAVREASDGAAFAAAAERECGVSVRIVEGGEEARLSAAGVLAGIRDADGIVGDLGGGSIELARVDAGAAVPIGGGVTLPLGPLRLAEFADNRRVLGEIVDRTLAAVPVLRDAADRTLYLVGGAWRAIARLHMEVTDYPLHVIHEYAIPRRPAEEFLDIVAGQSRRSLERITSISRRRLDVVPLAALILSRLIAVGRPARVVFSAFGLREGYAFGLLPRDPAGDPLLEGCIGMARTQSRWHGEDGERLARWIAPAFPGCAPDRRRLHRAACWLSDIAWTEHPDYRARHAFDRSLTMPLAQLDHGERVFIASALHTRYGGGADDPVKAATHTLIDPAAATEARGLGLALRLAYTLSGGALGLLDRVQLRGEGQSLLLDLPPGGLFTGEAVQRRLDALGRALGLETRSAQRRSASPTPA